AEDGIRDFHVTGVQTCALPILKFLAVLLTMDIGLESQRIKNIFLNASKLIEESAEMKKLFETILTELVQIPSESAMRLMRTASKIGRASCRERGETKVVARSST